MQPHDSSQSFAYRNGSIQTVVDLGSYRLSAVQKTAYRFAARCTVVIGATGQASLPISFTFPAGTPELAAIEVARQFFQELLDQELREQIAEETRPIRALILAHAFSKTDLIRHE